MGKKDNPFNDNPFGKYGGTSSSDPFQDETVPAAPGAWTEDRRGAWGGSGLPATIPLDNGPSTANGTEIQMQNARRKEQLDLREKELAAREAELKKKQEELVASGAIQRKKNWPRFYPITYHDIANEVPEPNRRMVRNCYWAFLGFLIAVTWNWFGALMALCVINPSSGRLAGFLLATVYWFAGVPGAWILWYIRIYNLAIKDRALVYAWFFLAFTIHIAFCIWSAVSPPLPFTNDWSHTGFVTSIKAFTPSTFVGVVYVIGGVFWSLESLWSFWAMKGVYSHFRTGGGARRMQQEAASEVASRAVAGRNFGAGDV